VSYQIIQGDCLEVMRGMPGGSFDLVFTSPPYNLGISTGGGMSRASAKTSRWRSAKLRSGYEDHDDRMPWPEYVAWQKEVLLECWRVLSSTGAIYYNHKPRVQAGELQTALDLNPGLPVRQIVIWCRQNGFQFNIAFYRPTHEWIVIFAKPDFRLRSQGLVGSGVGDVWHVPAETKENPHPAPFPVQLPLMALQTTSGGRVLDPFCGSGTTGVACVLAGREFVGIDTARQYCDQANARLAKVAAREQQAPLLLEADAGANQMHMSLEETA
jgi:DNA modification methylase